MQTTTFQYITDSPFSVDEVSQFRQDTTGCQHVIHLNNAGAGLMPDCVTKAVIAHTQLEATIGGYEASARQATAVQYFYEQAAALINCLPANIAFTCSATDAYTRALSAIPFLPGDVILTSNDDFVSNQIQFLSCQKRFGIRIERVNNLPTGGIDLQDLQEKLLRFQPRLLAITHIPTNAGLVQPVKEIGELFAAYAADRHDKSWYILDACQSIGQMKVDVQELKCDFLSVTCRKFLRGPRATGFLYVSDRALQAGLEPLFIDMRGADWIEKEQYRQQPTAMRFEDWEFPYAALIGTGVAIAYCRQIGEHRIQQQVTLLSDIMRLELKSMDKVTVLDKGPTLGGLVTFTVAGTTPQHLVQELANRKINVVPSYRKFAVIDFDEKKTAWAIRASPHYYNTLEEIDHFLYALQEII